MVLQTKSKV